MSGYSVGMISLRRIFAPVILAAALAAVQTSAQTIRVNEVFADNETNVFTDGNISDWVELYNTTAQPVDLAGYSLTDMPTVPRKWVFPAGVSISPNGYLVVLLDSSRPASTVAGPVLNAGFGAGATGDDVALYSPASVLVDSIRYGPQAANYSIGRIPTGTGNFVLTQPTPNAGNVAQPLGSQATLRINEWMASPSDGDDWFELYNPDPLPVALSGLYFTDDNNEPSPISALSFIGTGLDGFLQFVSGNSTEDNEFDFGLGAGGDSINLFFGNNTPIDRVEFEAQLEDISQGRMPDGSANIQSLSLPTPDESNLILFPGLVVNEVLSHTDPPLEDAVEFYNQTDAAINISGWYLSNSRNDLQRYRIPDNTVVPARGYLVIYENQFNGPGAVRPFTFSSSQGDQVYLSEAINNQLTGTIVTESFEPSQNGVSFGRHETSVPGDYKFVAMLERTFGADNPTTVEQFRTGTGKLNSGPRVGPVVINEIMYHPVSPDGGVTDNTIDEFVELLNITNTAVRLFDADFPTNRWILRGGVDFVFPPNISISEGGSVLVVSFDPADAGLLNAFRTKFSVPQSVPIYGPYTGRLSNAGDEVELYYPDTPEGPLQPDAGFVPYIRIDKVNYSDVAPWPAAADGTGMSLQRRTASAFGNDPIDWTAATPTAGGNGSPAQPQITGISVPDASAGSVIEFSSTAGRNYTVEFKNSLQSGTTWQTLTSTNAAGSTVTVQDPGAGGQSHRFYRIVTN